MVASDRWFVTIVVLLLSPRGDLAYLAAVAFALTAVVGIVVAAIIEFAVLPTAETFPGLCAAIGIVLIPIGFAAARSRKPVLVAMFGGLAVAIMRLLSLNNPMTYDIGQFYNTALAIFVGCGIGPLAFRLIPPLSPTVRARRLLVLTLRDLRGLAISATPPRLVDWERRMFDRLVALPDQATRSQRELLLAALSVGTDVCHLRHLIPLPGAAAELDAALASLARGNSSVAITLLYQLHRRLASDRATEPETNDALRVRGRIVAIADVLAGHGAYFDLRARA